MTDVLLGAHERIDDLMYKGRRIIQNEQEFCFSLDAVLLAHYPRLKSRMRVLDLGTGTGVMPLLIADLVQEVEAVEISPVMAELAARNVALNKLEGKIHVKEADYREITQLYPAESFDVVLSNPPYRPIGEGERNKLEGVARARHECTATLADVVRAARYALRFHGIFAMVHLPERLGEIMTELAKNQLAPKRLRMVQAKRDKPPNMMLIEAVVGGKKGGLKVDVPLIVYEEDGAYTKEILDIYGMT